MLYSTPLTLQNPHKLFRCAHCLWQLMRVPAGPGWHLRMSTELWVTFTDACEICGRLWMDRTSLRLRNGNLDGFRRILRIPTDLGGILRKPLVFGWVCAAACLTSVRGILIFKWRVASLSESCAASQLHVPSTAWVCHCLRHPFHKSPHPRSANCCLL